MSNINETKRFTDKTPSFKQPNYAWMETAVNSNAEVGTIKQYPFQSDFAHRNLEILAYSHGESAVIAGRFDTCCHRKDDEPAT